MSAKRVTIQQPAQTQFKTASKRVTIQTTPEPEGIESKTAPTAATKAAASNISASANTKANVTTNISASANTKLNVTTNAKVSANTNTKVSDNIKVSANTSSTNNSNNNTSITNNTNVSHSSATNDSSCISLNSISSQYAEDDGPCARAIGKYTNWSSQHAALAAQPWCCIGDLMAFCDKYEYKTLSLTDTKVHGHIVAEVQSLLAGGRAPFDMRKRFPGNIRNPENLWVCIGRCAGVEYHLSRILSVFRKPLEKLSTDKQRAARQNFHLAINELRLDISARITEVRLYDRLVFEREFQLQWQDLVE